MRVEVALGRTIERRILRVFSAMMILDVLQALAEVLVVVRLTPVCFVNNVCKERRELALADLSLIEANAGVTLGAELREKSSSNDESLVSVKLVVHWEEVFEVLLAKYFHE